MNDAKQLFLPEKISVGFQNRKDTYTKKLAYVIYYDQKGVLRKETSWNSWRDKKIKPVEFTNEPTSGFVLNKSGGGGRASYGWNVRNEFIRVYDPRDFEFEISVANLLYILRETDCSRGKGLEGKFVYAWDGTELVLLPEGSQEYQNSKNYTSLQSQGVKAKDMIPGASYVTKKQQKLIYLGRFDYYFMHDRNYREVSKADKAGFVKKFVFWDEELKQYGEKVSAKNKFVYLNELKTIASVTNPDVVANYATLVDYFNKSAHGSKIEKLFLKDAPDAPDSNYWRDNCWFYEDSNGFVECSTQEERRGMWEDYSKRDKKIIKSVLIRSRYSVIDGILQKNNYSAMMFPDEAAKAKYDRDYRYYSSHDKSIVIPWKQPTKQRLFALMESGAKIRVEDSTFTKG